MKRLRMGLVGGGPNAFIGPVHAMAARLDGEIEIVAGAFSSDPQKSLAAATIFGVMPGRAYGSFQQMIEVEAARPDGVDFITIATPNHLHLPVALAALRAKIPVFSEKPATASLAEVLQLAEAVNVSGVPYGLTFTYTGYPMVREARALCASGGLGPIRKVVVEYLQGWLSQPIELEGQKQAAWRGDPLKAGLGGCIGDIGVHAFNLVEFVTGHRVSDICPSLTAVVPGRILDDDCSVLLHLDNGAPGVLHASQVATGERNGLRIRIYGENAGLDWRQETPDRLVLLRANGRSEILYDGAGGMAQSTQAATRLPGGHPEGFLEALGNLYRDFAAAVRGDGSREVLVPGITDGVRSMAFVEAAVKTSAAGGGWTALNV